MAELGLIGCDRGRRRVVRGRELVDGLLGLHLLGPQTTLGILGAARSRCSAVISPSNFALSSPRYWFCSSIRDALHVPLNIASAGESMPDPDTYAVTATCCTALAAFASTRWSATTSERSRAICASSEVDASLCRVEPADERLRLCPLRGNLLLELGDIRLIAADARDRGTGRPGETGQDETQHAEPDDRDADATLSEHRECCPPP